MYSKCGCLEDACKVFDQVPERNTISWNAMLLGYAQHGHGRGEHYQRSSWVKIGIHISDCHS